MGCNYAVVIGCKALWVVVMVWLWCLLVFRCLLISAFLVTEPHSHSIFSVLFSLNSKCRKYKSVLFIKPHSGYYLDTQRH